jgi:integrase
MNTVVAILKLRDVLRRQHKALATEESYVHWLRHYMGALQTMPATLTSEQKLERFLTQLAVQRNVAASTQNQAFNAIIFFYKEVLAKPLQNVNALRATRPAHLRHAPTLGETRALLLTVRDLGGYPTNLVSRLLYGCGLRVSEPLNLRIKDANLERAVLFIRGAKGGKDRVVSLPPSLRVEMVQQRDRAREVWQCDKTGFP